MKPSAVCGIVLAWLCSMSDAVNVKVLSTKAVGKSGDTFQLKGKCTLKMPTDMLEPRGGQLTIQFDKETMKFKSGKVVVLTSNSTTYHVVNKKLEKKSKFKFSFTVQYIGSESNPPSGTCSDLQVITTSTSSTTSTTTPTLTTTANPATSSATPSSLPFSQQMTLISSWPQGAVTRFEGMFKFEVLHSVEPFMESFNISFGEPIASFESWEWDQQHPDPSITSGSWFLMTNRYWLQTPMEEIYFQATAADDLIPDVMCYSTLDEYVPGTTQQPETTQQPTQPPQTTQKPETTEQPTQPPQTTQKPDTTQPPVTTQRPDTTAAPGTTNQPPGTTQGPDDCNYVDVEPINDWSVSGNVRRMQGQCVFSLSEPVPANGLEIDLDWDKPTSDYEDYVMTTIDSDANGLWYYVKNTYPISGDSFKYEFQVSYVGPTPPEGRCYSNLDGNGGGGGNNPSTPEVTAQPTTSTPWNNSSPFNYADVIRKSILFYAAQRSGELPADNPIPWRGDSALGDQGENGEDLTGGWYDAGDNVKFNFPMASSVTLLAMGLYRYPEAYESAGQTDKMLDCIRWPLDYLLKCWNGDSSSPLYYAQVGDGDIDHAWWGRAEEMMMERPAYFLNKTRPGSDVTAETASAFAIAALVFNETDPTYSQTLLSAAVSLYDFADTYRGKYSDSITQVRSFYNSWSGYYDELMLSSVLLYQATGEPSYLSKARQAHGNLSGEKAFGLSWDDKRILAQLLMYEITGENEFRDLVHSFMERYRGIGTDHVQQTPGGLAWRDTWGSLRYAGNAAFMGLLAAEAGIQTNINRQWAASQIDYMLGDNPRSSSYVVGFGNNYPKQPHHGGASCPDLPAPCDWNNFNYNGPNPKVIHGALVGGPDIKDNYVDRRSDYIMNEVACDYNSGFQSALAGLLHLTLED